MTANDHFPQDWPAHFAQDAKVSPSGSAPPFGQALLDFTRMDSTTFEQFCWWLLKKEHTLAGCKRLGGPGTEQEGIDLLAFNTVDTGRLRVFECKAWKKFTATALTDAIDAFLKGDWAGSADSFTLILSQRDAGSAVLKRWEREKERLKRAGIEGDLWTAHNLTLKVERYPDILTKFFPFHSVETFANLWMERVAFYELVIKSFFDPRENVAQWARQLMGDEHSRGETDLSEPGPARPVGEPDRAALTCEETGELYRASPFIDGIYRKITQFGNSWHFKGPWFHFSAILPDERFTHASAAITFNRPDMQGMVLTVDHTWLLTRFLFKIGAPLQSLCRDIVLGEVPNEPGLFVLDLPHCRLSLQEPGVRELLEVADRLTLAMRDALIALELAWSAQHFPFMMRGGKKVALAAIPKSLWHAIGQFAFEHDESKGDTGWHMFDGNTQVLKPFHKFATERFDTGYHGIFYADEVDDLSYRDEVVILWQPDGPHPELGCSPRGWWSCEDAAAWLNDALLPEVKRWAYQRKYGTAWLRLFKSDKAEAYAHYLEETFVMRDLREQPLLAEGKLTRSVVESVQELQSFFYGPSAERYYIRPGEVDALYEAVAVAAKARRGYVGYAQSKLEIRENSVDHADLIVHIRQHVREGRVRASSGAADGALRALLEMLSDSDAHLDYVDRRAITDSLIPFAIILDEAMFIRRHTKWS
ncbi:hypothetical protein HF313_30655 [Massilia atriviolacea]|uniref:Restriction endonuclease type IV Mrr domain-containing protein n=1 Tax=Massilia atriviolacea TaxID=2495579 RepID=A0A430HC30_9BURK|nr:hypothetical protein [Massilia atriviolacea]RSZ55080.1 hypothetical protein EJB06_31320 [Massilia atriviolacea]